MKIPFPTKPAPSKSIRLNGQDEETADNELHSPTTVGQLPLDILENKHEIRIIAPLAGVNIEETEIVLNNDVLTIKGKRELDSDIANMKNAEFFTQECYWGAFSRSVILPLHTDPSRIEATQKDQVLYITIPKRAHVQMKIVKIKSK
jgi:HSP20 family protein